MYNLVIDIGNTLAKMALFENQRIIKATSSDNLNPETIKNFIENREINAAILSSVRQEMTELETYLSETFKYYRFNIQLKNSVKIHYKTPSTLGLDRLAAVTGASALFPNSNCLVVDAGTCITYDFIDKDKNYYGGSISPGINMRYKAMHTFTGKLPLINFDGSFSGNNGIDTTSSMQSGVQNGILYEVLGFIQSYQKQYPDLIIALCGGDSNYFDTQLKNSIFAPNVKTIPDLVLIGLNEVIKQQND